MKSHNDFHGLFDYCLTFALAVNDDLVFFTGLQDFFDSDVNFL